MSKRRVKRAAAPAQPRLPIEVFVACEPGVKGNSKRILRSWTGRPFVAAKASDAAAERALVALLAAHKARPPVPLDRPLRVDVEVRVAVPASWSAKKRAAALRGEVMPATRPDRGNYLKLAEDALERAGYVVDDARIVCGDVAKVYAETAGWFFRIDDPIRVNDPLETFRFAGLM